MAFSRRIRHWSGTGALTEELRQHVQEADSRVVDLENTCADLTRQLDELVASVKSGSADVDTRIARALSRIADARDQARGAYEHLTAQIGGLDDRLAHLERLAAIDAVTSWVEAAHLEPTTLVSVVLPTRNRAALLPRAVDSVIAQAYPNWELVIVDDGSTDETPAVIDAIEDQRVRSIRVDVTGGVCAARNRALNMCRGDLVAYLDDDNTMAPLWLKGVVWAFRERPEVDVVYGAFVVDDHRRVNQSDAGALPALFFWPFDRDHVLGANVADISAMAHRRGLAGARFDESLREMGDWDLLIRLTREKEPLALPVVACHYSTSAPNRLSGGPTAERDYAYVRRKNSEAGRRG